MKEEELKIEQLVYSFFVEMNKWEKYCYKVDRDKSLSFEEQELKQIEKATEIVDKYFTKKERKMGLPNCISYGHEGSYRYNIEEEKITSIEIEKNKATVTTQREKPMNEQYIYTLKSIKNDWRIDSKKRFSVGKEKWVNEIL